MKKKYKNVHTGEIYGSWLILNENDFEQKKDYKKVLCQCQCINKTIKYVDERSLQTGKSTSCGNCTFKNIQIGDIFGEWTVLDNIKYKGKVLCKCTCGTEKMVNVFNLQRCISTNCGCIKKQNHFAKNQNTESGEVIIIGNTYNKWLALEQVKSQSYLCECSCPYHTRQIVKRSELLGSKRCGCKRCRMMQNLIGQVFGYLTVVELDNEMTASKHATHWKCKCKCGNEITYSQEVLHKGRAISCGCKKSEYNLDLTGRHFGYLTVTKLIGRKHTNDKANSVIEWECKCDCGNTTIVRQGNLLHGSTYSCGCMKRSHGEERIYRYLLKHKFKFKEQYRINECRNILPLPFDFALFSCDKLLGVIEFDGQQHFEPYSFNNIDKDIAYENYIKCIERDTIKTNYCIENNIKLLRINYEDLENGDWIYMLWDFLYELGLIIDNVA